MIVIIFDTNITRNVHSNNRKALFVAKLAVFFYILIAVTAQADISTILAPIRSSTSIDENPATNSKRRPLECNYAQVLTVGDRKRELECCDQTVTNYHSQWIITKLPLSRYLAALKG